MNRSIITAGYATVDVVVGDNLGIAGGGTAVNVATAMTDLGWSSGYCGTVGDDPAGNFLISYLNDHGVETRHLLAHPQWLTPVILQERLRGDHAWRFSCPVCGARYAKHRPAPALAAEQLAQQLDAPDVYFFDRATLYGITLAEIWRERGTTVVFEPAGLGRPHLFQRAAEASHLIKYSSERGPSFADRLDHVDATVIETLGSAGARFRVNGDRNFNAPIPANAVENIVDSVGAGDWTTAGILSRLGKEQDIQAALISHDVLWEALVTGQTFGAAACTWEGVRSEPLTHLEPDDLEAFACPRVVSSRAALIG